MRNSCIQFTWINEQKWCFCNLIKTLKILYQRSDEIVIFVQCKYKDHAPEQREVQQLGDQQQHKPFTLKDNIC